MKSNPLQVTQDELDAWMNASRTKPVAKFNVISASALHELDDRDLADIACEDEGRSPVQAIGALLEGLRIRHADAASLAVYAAIQDYHLPRALALARDL